MKRITYSAYDSDITLHKSNNSDDALQIKPYFWWIKGLVFNKAIEKSEYTLANG